MLEKTLEAFALVGTPDTAIKIMEENSKYPFLIKEIGEYFVSIFNNNYKVLLTFCNILLQIQAYGRCYEILEDISSFNLNIKQLETVSKLRSLCIPHISEQFTTYPKDTVLKLEKKEKKPIQLVTFTITTCKRYELFEKTMNSFLNCCTDLNKIDNWFCIDDNSSEEDRNKMRDNYPFFTFYFKNISEKGHPQSMNLIKNSVKTPYIFHIEDDWLFVSKKNYISDCLSVISSNKNIGQCLINKNYTEKADEYIIPGGFLQKTEKGLRYFIHEHYKNDTEKMEFLKKYGDLPNSGYWPHYSLRPSLLKKEVWDNIGAFDEKVSHFEMKYSYSYRDKGYISAFLDSINCLHTGRLTSQINDPTKLNAYILNDEAQFSGKEEKVEKMEKVKTNEPSEKQVRIKTLVLNLSRRVDRWENFKKTVPKNFAYEKWNAIDGEKLIPTEQLQRIFDGNDYKMRAGMVGCAMSHIKMCIELLESKEHDVYCILEDDIIFSPNFKEKFDTICKILQSTTNDENYSWDICYLGYHLWNQYREKESERYFSKTAIPFIEKWDKTLSLERSIGGTVGYLISKKGAKRFLDFLNTKGMTNGIDTMQQKSADELHIYYSIPQIVFSDCWTTNKNADTDIQNSFLSLEIPVSKRLEEDKKLYENFELIDNFQIAQQKCKNSKTPFYYIAKANVSEVSELLQLSIYPCYSLSYCVFICIPNPEPLSIQTRYFDKYHKDFLYGRLIKNNKFNIDDALSINNGLQNKKYISIGDNTHVSEAVKKLFPTDLSFPFDTIDGENLQFATNLILEIGKMNDFEIQKYVENFCSGEIYFQDWNKKESLRNNILGISFPHENIETIKDEYFKRMINLRNILNSCHDLTLVFGTRWPINGSEEFKKLLNYYQNVRIVSINGLIEDENIERHKNIKIDFPIHFKFQNWTNEKIRFDQDIFRIKILESLRQ